MSRELSGETCIVYGADYSVYVRIVRLVLEEKQVDYRLIPVDIFAEEGRSAEYRARHPFGRIPAFEHDGFDLYETSAIVRYVDEEFPGQKLQPENSQARARMNQIIGIADFYAYRPMVWDVSVERLEKAEPDEAKIAAGLELSQQCCESIEALISDGPWLVGGKLTLADASLAPMMDYFVKAPEGKALLAAYPKLSAWWSLMSSRPSMLATVPTS
jgi:glutathione S-transferase